MTEAQRDYLADLAVKKGVKVDASIARSPAWASKEIERLKSLPDAKFDNPSKEFEAKVRGKIKRINAEIDKWQLQ